MERLQQQHWRGNIRELRNFVERLHDHDHRRSASTRATCPTRAARADGVAAVPSAASPAGEPRRLPSHAELDWMHAPTLQEFKSSSERAFLVAKLRENGWNISKTAEVIDTPRSNLYKKLEQYQISEETDGR